MASYVPRVLICGNIEAFKEKIGNKSVEIIGHITFNKTGDDVKLFFGEHALTEKDIKNLLDGVAEYLIFVDALDFYYYFKNFPANAQVISAETFAQKFHDGFFSIEMFYLLKELLNHKKFRHVLDWDCLFGKSDFRTRGGSNVDLDCIAENIYPIMENVYGKIYRSFDEYRFKIFDVIILSKERTPAGFVDILIETDALTENILAFVRKNSELESWLNKSQNIFARIEYFNVASGAWCLIKKIMPLVDVGVYVVTHKDAKLYTLPDGYKIIYAGHALAKKYFGYAGDDTGDNISQLNPFLDEVTVLYWIWKNTKHTHAGIVHYRRFFTSDIKQKTFDAEKILSAAEILSILSDYDIIVQNEGISTRSQRDMMIFSTGQPDLVKVAEKIIRNHLVRRQPGYLGAFDDVLSGLTLFFGGMYITRRNIFNAYCEWLFSFIIDATKEIRDKIEINGKSLEEMSHDYSRIAGFFAERMLTIWLMKNHLRIKTLPTMFREGV